MRVVVAVPPEPVVTWEEARDHLRLDGDAEQRALVEGMVAAATADIDGPDGWLGRAIGVQTLEARCDALADGLRLPYPPLLSVVSVSYLSQSGSEVTLPPDQYELRGSVVGSAVGKRWPPALSYPESVRIQYQAGYETLPPSIRAAILIMVADMYDNRGATEWEMPRNAARLLGPLRVFV